MIVADLPPAGRSRFRAWRALIALSVLRQARSRQMIWVSIGLLLIALALVFTERVRSGWSFAGRIHQYLPSGQAAKGKARSDPTAQIRSYGQLLNQTSATAILLPYDATTTAIESAVAGSFQAMLQRSRVFNFTRAIMFSLFLGFLLPVWCLSFATEPIGGERESRSLVWLLTRPLPRWSIYLAKYLSLLPWALAFTVGGFWLTCRVAGEPGREAFRLFWPAIVMGTLAFTALFHLFAVATRRPTVVGLVYCFFLETLLGDMPGLMKRISIIYYVRCMVFAAAEGSGIQPDKPSVYLPVSGPAASTVLATVTIGMLVLGAWVFSRAEYRDDGS